MSDERTRTRGNITRTWTRAGCACMHACRRACEARPPASIDKRTTGQELRHLSTIPPTPRHATPRKQRPCTRAIHSSTLATWKHTQPQSNATTISAIPGTGCPRRPDLGGSPSLARISPHTTIINITRRNICRLLMSASRHGDSFRLEHRSGRI